MFKFRKIISIFLIIGLSFTLSFAEQINQPHDQLYKRVGVGSWGYDSGWKGFDIGIGGYGRVVVDIGGDFLIIEENGQLRLETSNSQLCFVGSSGQISQNFGIEFGAQAKLVILGKEYYIDIPYIPYINLLLQDQENFTPYLLGQIRELQASLPRQEIVCVGVGIPFIASGEVCIDADAGNHFWLTGNQIQSSAGTYTYNNQQRNVSLSCSSPSITISSIRKEWGFSGTATISIYFVIQVSVVGIQYELPITIIHDYQIPINQWLASSFLTDPVSSETINYLCRQLTINESGSGTVDVDGTTRSLPWSGSFPDDQEVVLCANPDACYTWGYWSGALSGSSVCQDIIMSTNKTVTANFNPIELSTPNLSASPNPVCVNTKYCLSWNSVSGATSYEISENGGSWQNIGNTTSKCYTKSSGGSNSYRVRAKNNCATSDPSGSRTVVVNPLPGTPNTPTASSNPVDVNNKYCVSWNSVSGATSYEIRENNGSWTDVDNTTSHCYTKTSPGSYTYNVRAKNNCGPGGSSGTLTVVVNPVDELVAAFSGSPPLSGCTPLTVDFTDQSVGGPISWNWSFGDGSSSTEQNPSHTYNSSGTYTVTLTASNATESDTETKTDFIIVFDPPVAEFSATPLSSPTAPVTVYFTDLSTDATNWNWNFGDGSSSTLQNPNHTYTDCGLYTVTHTVYNDCTNDSETKSNYISVCNTLHCFTLNLSRGWNFVSVPYDPDGTPLDILNLILSDVSIVKGHTGFCIPGGVCTMPYWDCQKGYKIYMKSARSVEVCGDTCNSTISLPSGWSWISYLPDCCLDAEVALSSISECLVILKGMSGFYLPPNNFLGDMCRGQGYAAYLNCADVLSYPPCVFSGSGYTDNSNPLSKQTSSTRFGSITPTADYHPVVVDASSSLEIGDEVGLYTSNGILVGSGNYNGEDLALLAWADDPQTDAIDGWVEGDVITAYLWRSASSTLEESSAEILEGSATFGASPYTVMKLGASKTISTLPELSLSANYPNPFNPTTTIEFSLPTAGQVELSIYNVTGQKVITLIDQVYSAGEYQVVWNGKDARGNSVTSGVYFYKLSTGQYSKTKKMIMVK